MQTKRQEFLSEIKQEQQLRKAVRGAITLLETRRLQEETSLRQIIRTLIAEAKPGDLKVHDETGMNYLEHLVSNTSFLNDLKSGYVSLTTSPEQRSSYAAHILGAAKALLERDRLNRGEDEESEGETTALKATPAGGFDLNVTDKETNNQRELETEAAEKFQMLPGMDETGAAAAENAWNSLGQLIKNELKKARDPRDRALFAEYLIKNLVGYFEEWEKSMSTVKPGMDAPMPL
jgi:hypothetical protein